MNKKQLESAVQQTVIELDQTGKDGLTFREFEKIFLKRTDEDKLNANNFSLV